MAAKRFEKGTMENEFFGDFWKFCQYFYIPEDNTEYWDALINASSELERKYNHDDMVAHLICGYLDYLNKKPIEKRT